AERAQLGIDLLGPAAIGERARRARMQDLPDSRGTVGRVRALEHDTEALERVAADADRPARFERVERAAQMAVAGVLQRLQLGDRQLVGRAVASAFGQ